MTTSRVYFQVKNGIEERGTGLFLREHWLSPGGGLSGMLTTASAGLCFRAELGCPGADSPGREMWLWEMWCSRCCHGQEEQCQTLGAWQSWVLAPHSEKRVSFWVSFPPGNEKSQWSIHLCVFMWERRATRFLSHTYLCKNAKGGVICFLSVLFLAEEGVVIVC